MRSSLRASVRNATQLKIGAFVRNVHIYLKSGPQLPDLLFIGTENRAYSLPDNKWRLQYYVRMK